MNRVNFNWQIKHYNDLLINEFHDLISLRLEVFVVEQNCAYQDLDGKDKKSYHLICRNGQGKVVATARILPPGISYQDVSIGRIVTDSSIRGKGVGHELMLKTMQFIKEEFGNIAIVISAQSHLISFYNQHGFITTNKEYLEDGIPHTEMIYKP